MKNCTSIGSSTRALPIKGFLTDRPFSVLGWFTDTDLELLLYQSGLHQPHDSFVCGKLPGMEINQPVWEFDQYNYWELYQALRSAAILKLHFWLRAGGHSGKDHQHR